MNRIIMAITICFSFLLIGCYTRLAKSKENHFPSYGPYYPSNLGIVYHSGTDELNSVEGYIIKDVGDAGYAKINIVLTQDDRIKIYNAIKDMDIASYPEYIGSGVTTFSHKQLWIKYENIEKSISWDLSGAPKDEKVEKLRQLQKVLDDALYNNPFYQTMPEYQGPPRL